jgi:uncharacterized repeat protein (TIGR03803 family)
MTQIGGCLANCFAVGALALGAFFHVPAAAAATETVVYSFCSEQGCPDGEFPLAGLTDVKGKLYGTTEAGGASRVGTVFSVDRKTGTETVLYSFANSPDGAVPFAGVIDLNGTLYGTTNQGGAYNSGTVFAIELKTGAERVLHSFGNGPDGQFPQAGLIYVNGTLYGTTSAGGGSGEGTVFSLDLKTGTETVLHAFGNSPDGASPQAGLVDVNGTLYGTTYSGGANECFKFESDGCGTVFSIDLKTGNETVVHSFIGGTGDGTEPAAGLIDVKGTLFGTTEGGGFGGGTVFTIDPKTGAESVYYSFVSGSDGANPSAGLIEAKGILYGTTANGGVSGEGTVFSLDPKSGGETLLYSFGNGTDGENPSAGLIDVKGTLYGTTFVGGTGDDGTVFAIVVRTNRGLHFMLPQ